MPEFPTQCPVTADNLTGWSLDCLVVCRDDDIVILPLIQMKLSADSFHLEVGSLRNRALCLTEQHPSVGIAVAATKNASHARLPSHKHGQLCLYGRWAKRGTAEDSLPIASPLNIWVTLPFSAFNSGIGFIVKADLCWDSEVPYMFQRAIWGDLPGFP